MSIRHRRLGILVLAALVTACSDTNENNPIVPPPPPPPPDATRPADPGLSFDLDCLASLPIENPLQAGGRPDGIPALVDPGFLSPENAAFMKPDDEIFGVEIEGRFFAFPSKIMHYHEVANFTVESSRFAATWCPLSYTYLLFRNPRWDNATSGRSASFKVSGALMDNNLVMFDVETRTTWPQVLGMGNSGELEGSCLEYRRNGVLTRWDFWLRLHPETVVLSDQNQAKTGIVPGWYNTNPYEDYHAGTSPILWPVSRPDSRLEDRTIVLGVHGKGGRAAVLVSKPVSAGVVGETPVVFFQEPARRTTFAFENSLDGVERTFIEADPDEAGLPRFRDLESETLWSLDGIGLEGPLAGRRLAQMPSLPVYWFVWATFFPDNPILRP